MKKFLLRTPAFTLMEIIVVLVIVSFIAGYGITNYYKSQERAYVKNATSQMKLIEKAQDMYFVKNAEYFPPANWGGTVYAYSIDANLNTHIIENGFKFRCFNTSNDSTYRCEAEREGESGSGEAYSVVLEKDADGTVTIACDDGTVRACP